MLKDGECVIIDISGIELTPGNNGGDCKGNGKHLDEKGNVIECCCDECNYLMCCMSENPGCSECSDLNCIRKIQK